MWRSAIALPFLPSDLSLFIYSVTVSLLGHSTTRSRPSSHERTADGPDRSEPWNGFASRLLISYVLLRRLESSCFYFGISSAPMESVSGCPCELAAKWHGNCAILICRWTIYRRRLRPRGRGRTYRDCIMHGLWMLGRIASPSHH